ncbi:uncharacterized protein LOC105763468 [Gossypium raimondii]|uniref:uncharacterized protein LOC105763468 n=1 Tax=Gossypium raimondii TaxID=29730 RepID=UPI00063ABFDE|nr:uncharacterized protein LOC105763468 [Gossypium raimondii]
MGSSSASTEKSPPMSMYIFRGIDIPHILCSHADSDYVTYVELDAAACPLNDNNTDPAVDVSFDARVNVDIYGTAPYSSTEELNGDQVEEEDEHNDEGEYGDEHEDDGEDGEDRDDDDEGEGEGEDEHNDGEN